MTHHIRLPINDNWTERTGNLLKMAAQIGERRQFVECPIVKKCDWSTLTTTTFSLMFLRELRNKLNREIYITLTTKIGFITTVVYISGVEVSFLGGTYKSSSYTLSEFRRVLTASDHFLTRLTTLGLVPNEDIWKLMKLNKQFFESIFLVLLPWWEELFKRLEDAEFSGCSGNKQDIRLFLDNETGIPTKAEQKLQKVMQEWSRRFWCEDLCIRFPQSIANYVKAIMVRSKLLPDTLFTNLYNNCWFGSSGLTFDETYLPSDCSQVQRRTFQILVDEYVRKGFREHSPIPHMFASKEFKKTLVDVKELITNEEKSVKEVSSVAQVDLLSLRSDTDNVVACALRIEQFLKCLLERMGWKLLQYVNKKHSESYTVYVWTSRSPYAFLGGEGRHESENTAYLCALTTFLLRMVEIGLLTETIASLIRQDSRWLDVFIEPCTKILKSLTLAQDHPKVKISLKKVVQEEQDSGYPQDEREGKLMDMCTFLTDETLRLSKMFWTRQRVKAPKGTFVPRNLPLIPTIDRDPEDVIQQKKQEEILEMGGLYEQMSSSSYSSVYPSTSFSHSSMGIPQVSHPSSLYSPMLSSFQLPINTNGDIPCSSTLSLSASSLRSRSPHRSHSSRPHASSQRSRSRSPLQSSSSNGSSSFSSRRQPAPPGISMNSPSGWTGYSTQQNGSFGR